MATRGAARSALHRTCKHDGAVRLARHIRATPDAALCPAAQGALDRHQIKPSRVRVMHLRVRVKCGFR